MARLAQAASSETFGSWGLPGNQRRSAAGDDGELNIVSMYAGFTTCFRWSDPDLGARAADLAVRIVKNAKVGYSQNNAASPRTSLIKELRACHWRPEDIQNKCNCDCSSLIMTLLRYNDLDSVTETMYTGDQCAQMRATGAFIEYDITPGFLYQLGDIVWKKGHTAIVCEADPAPKLSGYAQIINCAAANIRSGPGVDHKVSGTIDGGQYVLFIGPAANGWAAVQQGALIGYVSPKLHRVLDAAVIGNCKSCNMRTGAGTSEAKIRVLRSGYEIALTGQIRKIKKTTWFEIVYKDRIGWVSGRFVIQ